MDHTTERQRIINKLRERLGPKDYVYALWEEGSLPQGYGDEYSDLDFWVSTDNDRVHSLFIEIEQILSELGELDFRYANKPRGELGAVTYHIKGMNEYLQIDVNTQGVDREIYLTRGVDDANVIFDKRGVVKYKERDLANNDVAAERQQLRDFYYQMLPRLDKSIKRGLPLEELYYWQQILQHATKFLRRKHGWPDKLEYDLKHIHRDLPAAEAERLREFYDTKISEIAKRLPELKNWLWDL